MLLFLTSRIDCSADNLSATPSYRITIGNFHAFASRRSDCARRALVGILLFLTSAPNIDNNQPLSAARRAFWDCGTVFSVEFFAACALFRRFCLGSSSGYFLYSAFPDKLCFVCVYLVRCSVFSARFGPFDGAFSVILSRPDGIVKLRRGYFFRIFFD